MREYLRTVYMRRADDAGNSYRLRTWATGRYDDRGQQWVGYELAIKAPESGRKPYTVLFTGEDYSPSPCRAIDSDDACGGLLMFLVLKPGDTDSDYFNSYTPGQLAWCKRHAEALQLEVMHRFGEDI